MKRFFSDNSYWNTPIGRSPKIDRDSERLTALMATHPLSGFWMNLDYWTIPVYEVGPETPRYEVQRYLSARNF